MMNPRLYSPAARIFARTGRDMPFGAHFVRNCIPRAWRSTLLSGGAWNEDTRIKAIEHIARLDAFAHPKLGPFSSAHRSRVWRLGSELARWLRRAPRTVVEPLVTGLCGGFSQWQFQYESGGFEGRYSVLLWPIGRRKTLLVAHLAEVPASPRASRSRR